VASIHLQPKEEALLASGRTSRGEREKKRSTSHEGGKKKRGKKTSPISEMQKRKERAPMSKILEQQESKKKKKGKTTPPSPKKKRSETSSLSHEKGPVDREGEGGGRKGEGTISPKFDWKERVFPASTLAEKGTRCRRKH